jgi:hypothetical protein
MNKNQTIELLKQQMPGFYSVDQVIKLIEGIEESSTTIPDDTIRELIDAVTETINTTLNEIDSSDVVDYDSAEFNIEYDNKLELERVDIDTDNIADTLNAAIEDKIKEYFN